MLTIGGATGMGFATAKLAENLGARVYIDGHNKDKNKRALAQLSNTAHGYYLDVINPKSIKELFDSLERIDHIFITAAPEILRMHL
ncbi:SDR family oxidoreductase [Aquimarina sp. U1-2]|uniref:SDR family oxidoreductase n=1 Tax=Aquimarina sp. U1-2 TaxID=2823141 RepID=UPI001AECF9D9|nr:SDR family oxidoreductase [Aquimarina sp. U1-2]